MIEPETTVWTDPRNVWWTGETATFTFDLGAVTQVSVLIVSVDNNDRYDSYDRSGPKVFLGEYASQDAKLFNSLSEAAYIAALPKGAENYHPFRHPEAAIERRNWVLDRMLEQWRRERPEIDATLADVTTNWRLERLGAIERSVLRLGAAELHRGETPPRVVIQEAVTLAERFGSAQSARFVNGVLDALARRMGRM